jgi:hypothetical protein
MTMGVPHFADSGLRVPGVSGEARRDEDSPMHVVSLSPPVSSPELVRCECAHCGSHVKVRQSWQLAGRCQNCGGYDLRALEAAAPAPPAPVVTALRLAREAPGDLVFAAKNVA